MKTIKICNDCPSERQLAEICRDLENGSVMILPTDSIYAIVCDALNPKTIERVCRLKGINPEKSNLSILCSSISMASEYAKIENKAFGILRNHTPGPFTVLMRASSSLPKAFKNRKTVGVRIPDNNIALRVVERLGHPLLSTSVEFDDEDYAVSPGLIGENYSNSVDVMIEGAEGDTVPSTVIDCTGDDPLIVRQGKGEIQL